MTKLCTPMHVAAGTINTNYARTSLSECTAVSVVPCGDGDPTTVQHQEALKTGAATVKMTMMSIEDVAQK